MFDKFLRIENRNSGVNYMYNEIFKIGPITIRGYGLMISIGVLCALFVLLKRAKKKGVKEDTIYTLGFIVLLSGVIGAKLLYVLVEIKTVINYPLQILSGNGFVVYGGIIGGLLMGMAYCNLKKLDFLLLFDLVMPSVALAQGFGRIGCFFAGCCYGSETDSVIGIVFHNSSIAPNDVKLLPTQLFSSAGDFLIATFLILYANKAKSKGEIGALYLVLYSIGRFVIEFFRNDYRGSIGIISTSQFISLVILVIGIVMLIKVKTLLGNKDKAI